MARCFPSLDEYVLEETTTALDIDEVQTRWL